MEKIDLYEASIEKVIVSKPNNMAKVWWMVGLFVNKEDAENAIKLYKLVYRNAMGENLHNPSVDKKYFPQSVIRHRKYKKYYENLDEFIDDNLNIKRYLEVNKLTAKEQLEEINQAEMKAEKELRIIERLIKEYSIQLEFAKKDNLMEETIQKLEENVEYLESLRDERTKLVR